MPVFEVELSDGRIVEIESDAEPDEQSVMTALGSYESGPSSEIREAGATIPEEVQSPFINPELSYVRGMGAIPEGVGEFTPPSPFITPEQNEIAMERAAIPEVPYELRAAAAAHSQLQQGMQLPSTILRVGQRAALPVLGAIGEVAGQIMPSGLNQMRREAQASMERGNEEYFRRVGEWERGMNERDAMLGEQDFGIQAIGATARGVGELPTQLLASITGASAAGPARAITGAAAASGATAGATETGRRLGEGEDFGSAAIQGGTSGLITALTTRAFGATGVESIFRNQGPRGVASRIVDALKQGGYEAGEEMVDTVQQELLNYATRNPNQPIGEAVRNVLLSGVVGGVLGTGVSAAGAAGRTEPQATAQPDEEEARYLQMEREGMAMDSQRDTPEDPAEAQYRQMEREGMAMENQGELSPVQRQQFDRLQTKWFENSEMSDRELAEFDALEARNRAQMMGRARGEPPVGMITEAQQLLNEAVQAEGISDIAEIVGPTEMKPDNPLSGRVAQFDPTSGKIQINGRALVQDIQVLSPARRKEYIRSMINEEGIHSRTRRDDAMAFYDNASAVERRLAERIYSGKWGRSLSPEQLGYEMIRRRFQHLSKIKPTEIAFAVGRERWTLASYDALDRMIDGARRALGTKASKAQREMLDRVERNVQIAREVTSNIDVGSPRRETQELVQRVKSGGEFRSNAEAVQAGLNAESVADLDAMLDAKREVMARLQQARQNKDFVAMSGLVGPNQFMREAIEAATNSGSQRVDRRVTDYEKSLPLPKLDWRNNPEVADWLRQNGQELGIQIDESVGAPRRGVTQAEARRIEDQRKLRELRLAQQEGQAAPSGQAMSERMAQAYEPPTPDSVQSLAQQALSQKVPTFSDFVSRARTRHGNIQSGQLSETWRDAVWNKLNSASGAELEALVDQLGLRRQVFGKIQQGSRTLGLGGGAPPVIERKGTIADAAPADLQTTGVARAKARAAKLLERAAILEARAKKARTQQDATALAQRAQIMRGTAERLADAADRGEGMQMQQGDLLPGMTERTSTATGKRVPVPGKPGQFKFVTQAPTIPEIQPKGTQVAARDRAISAIARHLLTEAPSLRFGLNRREITPDDVRWNEFGNEIKLVLKEDLADLDQLGMELTERAATDASTQRIAGGGRIKIKEQALPRSATKRVVAFLDPRTKQVHLVSAYRDGRRGPVFLDPGSATGEHRTLDQLTRYRPMFSIPLDTPVQNFKQTFKSTKEFIGSFYGQVNRAAQRIGARGLGESPFIEGTEGLQGEGGAFMGPEADLARAELGMVEGAREAGADLTPQEGRALYRAFRVLETSADAENLISSLKAKADGARLNRAANAKIEDLTRRIDSLRERRAGETDANQEAITNSIQKLTDQIESIQSKKKPELSANDWLVITGMTKIDDALRGLQETQTVKGVGEVDLYRETLNEIYDIAKRNETEGAFVRSSQRQFAEGRGIPSEAGSPEAQSRTARELTMLSRRPPTDVSQAEPGQPQVPTGADPNRPAGIPIEPQRPPEGQQRRLYEERSRAMRVEAGRAKPREAEIASFPSSGRAEPENVRYETPEYKKREIEARVKQVASRISEQAPSQTTEPQQPTPQQGELGIGSLRRREPKTVGKLMQNVLSDFGSIYDKWMIDRLNEYGGPITKEAVPVFRQIIDRQKELYGQLTPLLDRARRLAGGVETNRGTNLRGVASDLPRQVRESANAMRAATWMGGLKNVTPRAAVSRGVEAIEGKITAPAYAQPMVTLGQQVNLEIGRMLQPVIPNFVASGLWQRNLTGLGYDIIRMGDGQMWKDWIMGMAVANRSPAAPLLSTYRDIKKNFEKLKEILDDPLSTAEQLEAVNQDMARRYPNTITHVKRHGRWQELVHSNLFNYLEQTAQRATHVRAFREQFPMDDVGQKNFTALMEAMARELTPEVLRDRDGLMRALNGHPTDEYSSGWQDYLRMGPQQFGGTIMRAMNSTLNNLLAKTALTAQMVTQTPEMVFGATPQKLGYWNYLKAVARARSLYQTMEILGSVNRVMHDYTFQPNSPIRSAFRMAGNVISKLSMQASLNEAQEALAAATAHVVTENIVTGRLSDWEKRMLPQTFKEMGFNRAEVQAMMAGDQTLLGQFQRRAASFLTGGNKSIAEGSRLGANRLFNSIFRFQTYPMMKMNQMRNTLTSLAEAWREGTPQEKRAATASAGRFIFGNLMQGAFLTMLSSLMFGGKSGLKIRMEEAEDEPFKFFAEATLASIGGPLYILWRGARHGGIKGVGEQGLRAAFPYSTVNELTDMADGAGKYRDKNTWDKIGTFIEGRTPGMRVINSSLAWFGLGNESQEIDQAINAFYRWSRDEMGFEELNRRVKNDERAEFRKNVNLALEAMKDGDEEQYVQAWMKAVDARDADSFSNSMRKRKLLVDINGAPLTEELKEKLQNRIGDEAYQRLEWYDMMLDAAAEGVIPVE